MGSQIDDFLQQKMDRKQFLKNVGAGLAAVVGLGMIARAFQTNQQKPQTRPEAYGSSVYGGKKPKMAAAPTRKVI